jgi:ABC-2 type transport system permease protein
MNRALLRKCLFEAQWLLWACGAAMFTFSWVRVWLVSRLDMGQFRSVIETFREEIEKFLPFSIEALFSYTGRIAVIYEEAIIVLCLVVWAVARGTDAVSGELGRGTMEMLLAQPLSRLQVLMHQAAVTVGGVVLLAALTWLGTFAGIQTISAKEEKPAPSIVSSLLKLQWPKKVKDKDKQYNYVPLRDKVDARVLLPGAVNLFGLGFLMAGLSTMVSANDRYRWRAIGVVVSIYVIQLVFKLIGVAVDDWKWLSYFTFFTAFEPQLLVQVALHHPEDAWTFWRSTSDPNARHVLSALGPLGFTGILCALGGVFYTLATVRFCTRDLPPPL